MRRRAARIAAAWSVALIQLLVSVGFASNVVLCVAMDGHIALEIPHAAGPCFTDYDRHHPGASRLDIVDIEDHGCRDTLLSQPAAWRKEGTAGASGLMQPAAVMFTLAARELVPASRFFEGRPCRSTVGQLARLRSIILLV
jgi:hypothetical protein